MEMVSHKQTISPKHSCRSESEPVHPVGGLEWIICLDYLDNLTPTQLTALSLSCLITDHRETQAA